MKWEYYKDNKGEWRSHFTAENGEILFVSSEGYINKQEMFHAIELLEVAMRMTVINGTYSLLPRIEIL